VLDSPPVGIPDQDAIFNLWMTPFTLLNSWNPFLATTSSWHHQGYEGFSAIGLEWQDFVARRFNEGSILVSKIATSRSPDQIWVAYAEFWQTAVDDYGKEFATMMKLASGVAAKSMAATQHANEGVRGARHVTKAA
jgi:hypothetical protein